MINEIEVRVNSMSWLSLCIIILVHCCWWCFIINSDHIIPPSGRSTQRNSGKHGHAPGYTWYARGGARGFLDCCTQQRLARQRGGLGVGESWSPCSESEATTDPMIAVGPLMTKVRSCRHTVWWLLITSVIFCFLNVGAATVRSYPSLLIPVHKPEPVKVDQWTILKYPEYGC